MKMIFKNKIKRVLFVFAVFLMILMILMIAMATRVYAANNNPMKITVSQIFSTSSASVDNKFTYILKPLELGSPMPAESAAEGYKFTINGTGDRQTSPIKYNRQGSYTYELFQVVEAEKPGYTYDRKIYRIEVYVDADLNVIVIVYNPEGDKTKDIVFMNSYYVYLPPPGTTPPVTTTEAATDPTTTAPATEPATEPATTTEAATNPSDPSDLLNPPTNPPNPPIETPEIITPTERVTEPTIDADIDWPYDMSPRPTEDPFVWQPVTIAEPTENPRIPPDPIVPGNKLIPDGDGGYIEVDDDGVPIGRWAWDEENGKWVFIEYPQDEVMVSTRWVEAEQWPVYQEPPKNPPKTGDESNIPLHVAMLVLAGITAVGATAYLFMGGKRREEESEE